MSSNPLLVGCAWCGAARRHPCIAVGTIRRPLGGGQRFHAARIDAAAAAPLPEAVARRASRDPGHDFAEPRRPRRTDDDQ
ncbi:hypothetical protein VT930_09605 [Mycobacterium sherrisii]|uniref:zinc finger domain-containing protein n=1 Tax=Mycobacterium sherrisii TaxID=243061 RepID=UPI002DDD37D1|nr:hypothetical protein [Mycobacterium sherrisii]MEC4763359.1 hypothetical protein [Mycobacterium sherrisii]